MNTAAKVALAGPWVAGVANLGLPLLNLSRGGWQRRTAFYRGRKRGILLIRSEAGLRLSTTARCRSRQR
jgi:hypothetical protein